MKRILILLILLFLVTGVNAGWLEDSLGINPVDEKVTIQTTVLPTESPVVLPTEDVALEPTLTGELSRVAVNKNGVKADRATNGLFQTKDKKISVFQSWADNLIPVSTITVRAFVKSDKDVVSLGDNTRMPVISDDGNWVAYEYAPDYETALPELHIKNLQTGQDQFVDYTSGGNQYGWTTQNFTITNNTTVSYFTTYPKETEFKLKSFNFITGVDET